MLVYKLMAWMCCTTVVFGQFVFQQKNVTLRNMLIDNSTNNLFVAGLDYIYKLNNNLTKLDEVNTTCPKKPFGNANQLMIIESLTGTRRLFACGTCEYGLCKTYDMNLGSQTLLVESVGVVPSSTNYSSVALEDPQNNGILIARTRTRTRTQTENVDYSFNTYYTSKCLGTLSRCIGKKSYLKLSGSRPEMYYTLAVIVGKFRYFFSYNTKYGTNVTRLCQSYDKTSEIKAYTEIPLQCVGKDGTKYNKLVAAKVVQPNEHFRSTGSNNSVLIGVFHQLSISSQSSICTFTFKQIDEMFTKNIKKCSSSTEVTRNEYDNNAKCEKEFNFDPCSEYTKNPRIVGTITCENKALITCDNCGSVSSMDTTNYQGNIIAFLGGNNGKLSKFIIYSNSSARRYETSDRINGSDILSVKFDSGGTSAYLLSQHKVLKIPVEECGNRTTCESCVENNDPYCGWCTLYAKCTTYEKCPDYGLPLRYVRKRGECIGISSLSPSSLALSGTRVQKVNISIVNLPVTQKKDAYGCSVNHVTMASTLNDDVMECSVPTSMHLPEASPETGLVKAEVAVLSNETNAKIATAMLEFYNCSAISSCLRCTTGSLECSWCHFEAKCSADASTVCPKSSSPWVSNTSQHQCPQLEGQVLYIPASVERAVTVMGTRLPKPESPHGEYQCTVTEAGQSYSIKATWINSTSITCEAQQYKYSREAIEVSANISVKLGKSDVKPAGEQVQVYLYQCRRTAQLCGSCVGYKKSEYNCGWCVITSSCSVSDGCPSGMWVKPAGKCPGSPKIQSFSPKTGHVMGNSTLKIEGTEFGRKYDDVEEVSIDGLRCKTIKKDYVIAKKIVCLTSNSSKSLSARIKVVISGKVGYSKEEFHYQDPHIYDYKPKIGPVSGGTKVSIYGKELDTGDDIRVSFGGSNCSDLSVFKTKMTCTTSEIRNVTRKRRAISNGKLSVTFNGLPPVYSSNLTGFQYVPNPVVTDISPRFTFPSSFRQIIVNGSNLNGIHFPKIRLTFPDKSSSVETSCYKPSFDNMICPLPNLTTIVRVKTKTEISLFLDGVKTWEDLSGHPEFNSLTIVPDPVINKFPGIHILKTARLEIEGRHLEVEEEKDLLKYTITVGGQKCNITGFGVSSPSVEVIFCNAPDQKYLPKQDTFEVLVNVSSSTLRFNVGRLKYEQVSSESSSNMEFIYIIVGVVAGVFFIFILMMICFIRRKKRQQEQKERTYELQMNSLESKVAKECREAFAELQTDMTDFTTDLGDGCIHYFDFKNYAKRVLFPGVDHHPVMDEKMAQESPKWDEALRTFSQLIGNKNFLLIFVKTLENQSQFKMQDRCNVASLLVIALQSKMDYCTDILQRLLAELIRKSMSKSHPKLLLRRTECVAEKLLTNWLTFTLSNFIKDKAGKPLFMLYKSIRFQVEKGPIDVITNEARYSLSEDKLLRQSIEYNKLTVTVEFEDNPPIQVDVLDTDTIEQAKEKIMEVLFKNVPFSSRVPKDELTLKWIESPSNHTILKDEDVTSLREGEWKRLNTLGHYQIPDGTCLRLVKRFAASFDTSEFRNASLPKVSYSPSLYSTASLVQSSKHNISDADRKPWHLSKHVDSFAPEKDDPRHSKMLSEIYLTRLLSTKGTLQQYVDDMFDCIFPMFRKNDRPPLPIKFLFDFLDDQAKELNITDPEVLHTWKNNSLPLRFWVNLIKNPNFLFDVYKAPIVDSCLSVIAQLFMDSCSVSDHILGKDSPSNKLLYAKEIPVYKQKVERFYQEVSKAPRLTDEEVTEFFAAHYIEDFNVDNALKELYKYAAKYQDELQEALEDACYPQLASKLEHVVAIFSDD